MNPIFVESTEEIKGQWESVTLCSRLPMLSSEHPISQCYQNGKEGMVRYIRTALLPRLENIPSKERRYYRLHRRQFVLTYWCTGTVFGGRYWSIGLKWKLDLPDCVKERDIVRVWDMEQGCLCPLSLFLPHQQSKAWDQWAFYAEEGRLLVTPRKGGEGRWIRREPLEGENLEFFTK